MGTIVYVSTNEDGTKVTSLATKKMFFQHYPELKLFFEHFNVTEFSFKVEKDGKTRLATLT
jgi:hypothetical protein